MSPVRAIFRALPRIFSLYKHTSPKIPWYKHTLGKFHAGDDNSWSPWPKCFRFFFPILKGVSRNPPDSSKEICDGDLVTEILLRRSCYGDSVTETPTHFNPYRFRQTLSTTHRRLIPPDSSKEICYGDLVTEILLRRSCYGDSVTETPTHFNPYRFPILNWCLSRASPTFD